MNNMFLDKKPNELNEEEIKQFLNGEIFIRVDSDYAIMSTPDKVYLSLRGPWHKEGE